MGIYEQRFKEALERARTWKEKSGMPEDRWGILDDIFPELKKSKDELVREELIHFLETCQDTRLVANQKREEWIEWLEKQGGKKPSDKVEPKFKVGDWVVEINFPRCHYRVIAVYESWYEAIDADDFHYSIDFKCEAKFRPWTIRDAKDGDVLANKDGCVFIYNPSESIGSTVRSYCYLSVQGNFLLEDYNTGSWLYVNKITPATREQCNVLFQKIEEAGYRWDSNRKELIGDEQQQ